LVILALATLVIRLGHYYWPYERIVKRFHPQDRKLARQGESQIDINKDID
jgi:hypothetical protein